MKFSAVLADPPWRFACWSDYSQNGDVKLSHASRRAERHYDTKPVSDLSKLPVVDVLCEDACLFMWATCPLLPQAIELMAAWGFEYKTVAFAWGKLNRDLSPYMGMGYWTRANTELCLLGTRGKPKRLAKDVRQLVLCGRGRHSAKPDEVYGRIERLVAGPYLEMYARPGLFHRDGWTHLGNEVDGQDMGKALEVLGAA